MEEFKTVPFTLLSLSGSLCHPWKGDKNLSPVYLIGHLSKFHAVMFAKVLVNFKSL